MRKTLMMCVVAVIAVTAFDGGDSTFTDKRDGKVYRIVKAGGRTWFAENLNYTAEGSVCYKNRADSCAKYGRLYNWETAITACPAGTHLPTDAEWTALVDYAGGGWKAVTNLKSSTGWGSYKNVPAGTDNYGFSALPGGISDGSFLAAGYIGGWWNATEYDANNAWCRIIAFHEEDVFREDGNKTYLMSVRCVQD
jgi:uncharacterized protein (TIGR02145 family)